MVEAQSRVAQLTQTKEVTPKLDLRRQARVCLLRGQGRERHSICKDVAARKDMGHSEKQSANLSQCSKHSLRTRPHLNYRRMEKSAFASRNPRGNWGG